MASSNESSMKIAPPPKWRAGCAPGVEPAELSEVPVDPGVFVAPATLPRAKAGLKINEMNKIYVT